MREQIKTQSNIEFTKWLIERWEVMNLQLSQLAVTFIGFLGVELALIAQVNPVQLKHVAHAKLFVIVLIIVLTLAILLFMAVIVSGKFYIPRSEKLRSYHNGNHIGEQNLSEYFLLSEGLNDEDLFKSLEDENIQLNLTYAPGIILSVLGQMLIAGLLVSRWLYS